MEAIKIPSGSEIEKNAKMYVEEAGKLLLTGDYQGAAARYDLAANEYAKLPGCESAVKENKAKYNFYNGLFLSYSLDFNWDFKAVSEAIESFEIAKSLFQETQNKIGEGGAEGWRLYMLGFQKEREGNAKEAKELYEQAIDFFEKTMKEAPEAKETIEGWISFARQGMVFSYAYEALKDPASERAEEAKELLLRFIEDTRNEDVKKLGEGMLSLLKAIRDFQKADIMLNNWEVKHVKVHLDDAEKNLKMAKNYISEISDKYRVQRESLKDMLQSHEDFNRANRSYANAILELLKGDLRKTREKLSDAYNGYKKAQDNYYGETSSLIDLRLRRITGMSEVLGEFSLKLGLGKRFLVVFLAIFSILVALTHLGYIEISGKMMVEVSLLVGIISAFGLMAGEILDKVRGFKLGG